MKKILFAFALLLFIGCESDTDLLLLKDSVPATLIPTMDAVDGGATRVVDQTWYTSDIVGVRMQGTGVVVTGYKQYRPEAGGTKVKLIPINAATETLYYPVNGETATFTAFCPYQAPVSDVVSYNLSDQSGTNDANVQKVDLVYHQGATGDKKNPTVNMGFQHKFSKLTIEATRGAGVTNALSDLKITVIDVPTVAGCTLSNGNVSVSTKGTVTPYHYDKLTGSCKARAIIAPHKGTAYTSRTIRFQIGSLDYRYTIPNTFEFAENTAYTFKFTLTQTAPILTDTQINKWGDGSIAWDGSGNWLRAPSEVKHYKEASTENKIVITTNHTATPGLQYSNSPTSIDGGSTFRGWFKQTGFSRTKSSSPYEWTLEYDVDAHSGSEPRDGYIYASVGGMTVVIGVEQSEKSESSGSGSGSGDGTANCYMVKLGGTVTFPATRAVLYGGASTTAAFTVEKLWDDAGSAVSSVTVAGTGSDAMITVKARNTPGNALVAAKVGDEIYWSWHIWVTDYDPDDGSATRMDRNLGAKSNDVSDYSQAGGLFYQWGRKDPFMATDQTNLGTSVGYIPNLPGSESARPDKYWTGGYVQYERIGLQYWVADWLYGKSKSVNDPCPTGWMVGNIDSNLKYPRPGVLHRTTGKLELKGKGGGVWGGNASVLQTTLYIHNILYSFRPECYSNVSYGAVRDEDVNISGQANTRMNTLHDLETFVDGGGKGKVLMYYWNDEEGNTTRLYINNDNLLTRYTGLNIRCCKE